MARALTDQQIESDKAAVAALNQSIDDLNGRVIAAPEPNLRVSHWDETRNPGGAGWQCAGQDHMNRSMHSRNRRWRRAYNRSIAPLPAGPPGSKLSR